MEHSNIPKPADLDVHTSEAAVDPHPPAPRTTYPLCVGMVATDPLRIDGMQAILRTGPNGRDDFAQIVPLSVPGMLNDGSLRIVLLDASCTTHLFELLETFRRVRPSVRVIVIGDSNEQEYIQRVIGAGAKGYLTQTAREAEIRLAVEIVEDGSVWAPRKVLSRLLDNTSDNGIRGGGKVVFTTREIEVLRHLVTGLGNREIAEALGIDENTVKAHITRLMRKVRVTNRIGLTMHALDYDLGADVNS
jgi:DNA-binding NarL/FixJ family response regulator